MSFWKVTWPPTNNEHWNNPATTEKLDKMRDAIIWEKIFGNQPSNWAITVKGNSGTVFGFSSLGVLPNTPIEFTDNGNGEYTLWYASNAYPVNTCRLTNVDSKDKIIKPDITPYILHKIILPATGLFATLAGLGYISSRAYNKRKPFI